MDPRASKKFLKKESFKYSQWIRAFFIAQYWKFSLDDLFIPWKRLFQTDTYAKIQE